MVGPTQIMSCSGWHSEA